MSQNIVVPGIDQPLEGNDLAPSLTVRDLERSATWYRETLGFTVDRKHERQGLTRRHLTQGRRRKLAADAG